MKPVENSKQLSGLLSSDSLNAKKTVPGSGPKDSIEISDTAKVYDRIDKFLNLGRPDRLDVSDLNDSEKKEFLKMLSDLIKRGVVGYEVLEVNGRPEKHFIVNQIGDERLYGAKLYNRKGYYKN
jgi:hypothetical protein